ncbi:MAG: flavin reductase [Candidatus Omnitrophota bacterium]
MFKEIKPQEIPDNPFEAIGTGWMLITAGNLKKYNMMTASWGGWGVLWHKNICFCVVRPGRYTYAFLEKADYFTLSYFDSQHKGKLEFCGAKSGRDVDKMKLAGLTPVEGLNGSVYFQEARLVIVCKKIYYQQINPENFLEASIENNYPNKDYHRMYVGEVLNCLLEK